MHYVMIFVVSSHHVSSVVGLLSGWEVHSARFTLSNCLLCSALPRVIWFWFAPHPVCV